MIFYTDILREGGKWLGAVRSWMQCNRRNGSTVTWGSSEVLQPPLSVRDLEEATAEAVAADRNARNAADADERLRDLAARLNYPSASAMLSDEGDAPIVHDLAEEVARLQGALKKAVPEDVRKAAERLHAVLQLGLVAEIQIPDVEASAEAALSALDPKKLREAQWVIVRHLLKLE